MVTITTVGIMLLYSLPGYILVKCKKREGFSWENIDSWRHLAQLQREVAIFVRHHRNTSSRHTHLPQGVTSLLVDHHAADHHLLGKHRQRSE